MDCRKNLKQPKMTDCVNCEYEDICKFESIIRGARGIENIHSENAKSIMDRIGETDKKLEEKYGGLYVAFLAVIFISKSI